jgi:hypothetical protein
LKPNLNDSAEALQNLALMADLIILDAIPTAESFTWDPGILHQQFLRKSIFWS